MKRKVIYRHPEFVNTDNIEIDAAENKRYSLVIPIDESKKEGITVILKNPSRAKRDVSDKTIFTVTNYIYKNRERIPQLKDIGKLTILNLMPFYLTDSTKLKELEDDIIDERNIEAIREITKRDKKVIIAWGNHPKGLYNEYEKLKTSVKQILRENKNDVYYVHKLSKDNNPCHGMVWGYHFELLDGQELIG